MARGGGRLQEKSARLAAFSPAAGEGRRQGFDLPFFLLVMLLLGIGVVAVLSASYPRAYYDPSHVTGGRPAYYFVRQLLFALLGVGAMLLASRLPMGFYRRFAFPFLGLTVLLLALVPVIGVRANGARRWLGIGGLTLQPSELAKLAVILSFAALICRFRGRMRRFRTGILPFAGILALLIGLLVLEPHFSASIILLAIAGAMLFLGGVPLGWFAAAFGAAGAGLGVLLAFFPYASSRIVTWRDPFSSASNEGYQIVQSLYTIGSGGLSGLGLGGSRQKFLYLPEEHNDFIFSVVCEELGFLGASLILVLFALLIWRGYWLALHARSRFSCLVCAGVTTLLALQTFLNVAVVTNLLPCTGISLPFFSYGGTALLIQLAEMGIVLSASREVLTER
ncbi:MAG: putative lipid II flippase FtsW [Oscillospiraceae bacterium]|nr:putative lipid II flippase FtsW [Oscillospiraceae bacterium]